MDTKQLYLNAQAEYITQLKSQFHVALSLVMAWVVVLGAVYIAQDRIFSTSLFAIEPQTVRGLIGVITAPLLHGSLEHIASNSFALLILGTLAGSLYPRASVLALPIVWLGSGLGTWFISLGGHHIGASGITVGMMFFLIGQGMRRRDRIALTALLLALFFFGGMILSFLPQAPGISWEYHLCGAVFGLFCGLMFARMDTQAPKRLYSWDVEPETDDDNTETDEYQLPRPEQVPILWQREEEKPHNRVIPFPSHRRH